MKTYQIRLTFKDSNPPIWRRVLVSAGLSFRELHEVIQKVFNFQDKHLYMFVLPNHKLRVTNDEEAYQVHQEYLENQDEMEKTLLALDSPFAMRQLENLRIAVHRPDMIKIGPYLKKGDVVDYIYDFGDNWELSVEVEKIEDVAISHCSVLLAGEQGAPVEDMGGLSEFEEFLAARNDPGHPDHALARAWGQEIGFSDYDGDAIQERLSSLGRTDQK